MNRIKEGFSSMVTGITGTGKSYWVKNSLIPVLVSFKPVIIFDRKGEYSGPLSKDTPRNWAGYKGIEKFKEHLVDTGTLLRDVHVINCQQDRDYIQGFRIFERLQKPVSLIIEEAHDIFLDREFYPAKRMLTKMVRYGRDWGVDVFMITQRTVDIPPKIRSQFQRLISFRQRHSGDMQAIEKMGFDDSEQVLDLDDRHYKIFGRFPDHIKNQIPGKYAVNE